MSVFINLEKEVADGIEKTGYKDYINRAIKNELFVNLIYDIVKLNHPEYIEYFDKLLVIK